MPRYIDADALNEVLTEHKDFYAPNLTALVNEAMASGLRIAIREVKNAPTADVAEVKHGEWIDKPTGAYSRMQSWCSVCGRHSGIGGIESNRHKPYCPNCGAKMDGERKEK